MDHSLVVYIRPSLETPVFRTDDGAPIPYGDRWSASPPESMYSVTAHPERFAPLGDVADAVVQHLVLTYEVTRTDLAADDGEAFPGWGTTITRGVRLVPANDDGAPLTLGWSDFPGVVGRAGAAIRIVQPTCGCDACDESLEYCAGQLEADVLAIAEGRTQERIEASGITIRRTDPGGSSAQSWTAGTGELHDPELLPRLRALPTGWRPWLRRQTQG